MAILISQYVFAYLDIVYITCLRFFLIFLDKKIDMSIVVEIFQTHESAELRISKFPQEKIIQRTFNIYVQSEIYI